MVKRRLPIFVNPSKEKTKATLKNNRKERSTEKKKSVSR